MGFDAKHDTDENLNGPWLQHLVSIVSLRDADEKILITKLEQNKCNTVFNRDLTVQIKVACTSGLQCLYSLVY